MKEQEQDPPAYYRVHVFCCINERPVGHPKGSCSGRGSVGLRDYMKARAKEFGLGDTRITATPARPEPELRA